jgi:hypothetical protein
VYTYLTLSSFGDYTFVPNRRTTRGDRLALRFAARDRFAIGFLRLGATRVPHHWHTAKKFMSSVQEVSFTHIGGAELFVASQLQRRSSAGVLDYHQMRFLDRYRCVTTDNLGLSAVVLL